ncbi:short-chain dehydrogenase/reductase [Capsaspora owczarzaki ATCC 30864]|uniref:Short-chain dehydrogenase/reductase n=1 Tax=Capsaspora owczarzaki (strain ATCC 30864) TaxID=595528 RepID=A0A0D2WQD1_CAPO3|nr:short-chain dehydrogenase/reductase [Capsaspora owczarzaki ATCC 30864]KJE93855.1 short-chain dehydrogenase/reductase [Capsaspora owczarzaki ATCC 30864]|eukprot:XP_004347327.1 short-chain dehydrogenase/reductase [Capsaspora owczarzaki ATCC 30864]
MAVLDFDWLWDALPGSFQTPIAQNLLAVLGLLVLARAALLPVLRALRGIFSFFLRPGKNLKRLGEWAVVTGATDGIGEAYAHELARKGLNIVLISRTQAKLDKTAGEIAAKHKVNTQTIAFDFSQLNASTAGPLRARLANLDVGVLVNNVGVSYDHPAFFTELSEAKLLDLIQLNITSTTLITQMILPGMVERKRGAIVNVSSYSGMRPTPLLTVYSAAKGYVDYFSRALELEYSSKGISIQSVTPLLVVSKLSKVRAALTIPTPTAFARQAVATIGHDSRTLGYWAHALQSWAISLLPEDMSDKLLMNHHLSIRSRALKRANAKKGE